MRTSLLILNLLFTTVFMAQIEEELPFYEIPDNPETYTAGTVAARTIDGLGFRFYWATQGLRNEDLSHKTCASGRTSAETIAHIYALSKFIRNSILVDNKDENRTELSFKDQRKQTLLNLKLVSDVLRDTKTPYNLESSEIPFWNIINGPIEDALWHCGQIVMLRRASGNPFSSDVNLFKGSLKK
ncbi:hypothetical protein FPF71_09680 [Algibacter amylolyticus]|uniref:DinB family protein n=1 Tax=Algibacter amylolyticus TaxID=1608400 RepID=A0A5M7B6X7_9FLAO|nr:hypothetical protein [Algibacter amylolyticus]KAA5824440.1 hypothetical protein F2B50_09680 [Algibacter amylolyticus]MBB5269502.1 hypothetical protein [Algibacter amylolyticus]TSJ75213.1 hypothetical protein FPF71_09680 [Algibacter amylolyticus]